MLLPLLTVYVTGGVLVTVTANLLSKEIRKLQTDAVSIWIQINMTNTTKLIVEIYYGPLSDNGASIDQLDISLDGIHKNAKTTIIFSEHSLEQIVKKPPRGDRILDLILTNIPSIVNTVETMPPIGNTDQDIVRMCTISETK